MIRSEQNHFEESLNYQRRMSRTSADEITVIYETSDIKQNRKILIRREVLRIRNESTVANCENIIYLGFKYSGYETRKFDSFPINLSIQYNTIQIFITLQAMWAIPSFVRYAIIPTSF